MKELHRKVAALDRKTSEQSQILTQIGNKEWNNADHGVMTQGNSQNIPGGYIVRGKFAYDPESKDL